VEKQIEFHLEDFTGPLDLLLALISKHKKSIYDIEIHSLIDQYLQVVGGVGPDELDSASEFVAMAARFVQMKSFLLLPKSEEAERIREELTGLLVEYSACKEIAARLGEMAKGVYIVVRTPVEVEFDSTYNGRHGVADLANAFSAMMGRSMARRLPRQEQFEEIVAAPIVSVTSRVIYVLKGLKNGTLSRLKEVFLQCRTRSETVATFLAVLELVRGGRIAVDDEEGLRLQKKARRA
jgi:segregation and condensation protein A